MYRALIALLALGSLSSAASAQATAAIDLSYGRLLTQACTACHGSDGHTLGELPQLAGHSAKDLAQMLRDYKYDRNPQATLMNRLAKGYEDWEIDMMAAYIAQTMPAIGGER